MNLRTAFACGAVTLAMGMQLYSAPQDKGAQPPQAPEKAPAQGEKAPLSPSRVVARVGDRVLTVGEIQQEFARIPPQFSSYFDQGERKEQHVQNLVDKLLFARKAREQGALQKEEIKRKIDSYIEMVLYSEFLRSITESLQVSPEEIRQYYEANRETFSTPERVRARHILVKTEEEAKKVKAELDAGAAWDELAKNYSTDKRTALRGGDLGFFRRGDLPEKEVETAAFGMAAGSVSAPVKSRLGWHIIRLEEKKPREIQPLGSVENSIQNRLLNQKRKDRIEQVRTELFKEYGAEFNRDLVRDIPVNSNAPTPQQPPRPSGAAVEPK